MAPHLTLLPPIPVRSATPAPKILLASGIVSLFSSWLTRSTSSPLLGLIGPDKLGKLRLLALAPPAFAVMHLVKRFFSVPQELAHLPRVPLLPLLQSYARGEADHVRFTNLLLPLAERGHGVALVWALGRWMVHVLDPHLGRAHAENIVAFPKEAPPDGMLLWHLIGSENITLSNGESWKRHAANVRRALGGPVPITEFAELTQRMIFQFGNGGRIAFSNWAQRFTLDAIGRTAFGYDFNAIEDANTPFIRQYNNIMCAIAKPLYIVLPILEKIFPRREVIHDINSVRALFDSIIAEKCADRERGTNGMLSIMIDDDTLTDDEIRDNLIVFFMAGHDTTAGALSSFAYYMATNPGIQSRARAEVLSILGSRTPGSASDIDSSSLPYFNACLREVLRLNTPITSGVPRVCSNPVRLGDYAIPAHTSYIYNVFVIHHTETIWNDPFAFRPERYLTESGGRIPEAWTPFLVGPRQCTARNFALYEMRTFAAMILREFEWTLPADSIHRDGIRNAFSPFALSLPFDLHLDFKRVSL